MFSLAHRFREPPLSQRPSVTELEVHDIRFPTSEQLDGSDAMNPDPDYSAAYVVLRTDAGEEGRPPRVTASSSPSAAATMSPRPPSAPCAPMWWAAPRP
ncbi:hypothetical protein SVIO_029760 [Streptomyces violaceusniger]|uniref:Uncharacterized protein n=1 Tax=Streptomyces violaceusniger TaxID=68280 RepID=A0A4D4L2W7_STRVO|nr:hypothetical protein SVIO_029760 [Streptomyces violaceusniger]